MEGSSWVGPWLSHFLRWGHLGLLRKWWLPAVSAIQHFYITKGLNIGVLNIAPSFTLNITMSIKNSTCSLVGWLSRQECMVSQTDELSSIPGTFYGSLKTDLWKLSSDFYTCAMVCECLHSHIPITQTHMHTINRQTSMGKHTGNSALELRWRDYCSMAQSSEHLPTSWPEVPWAPEKTYMAE